MASTSLQLRLPSPGARRTLFAGAAAIAVLVPTFHLQGLAWLSSLTTAITLVVPCLVLGRLMWKRLMRPTAQRPLRAALAKHAGWALVFSVGWTCIFVLVTYSARPETWDRGLREGAPWLLLWGVFIYASMALLADAQRQLAERKAAAMNAELQALRAQLNPHFLFNTLHSLSQLAREDPRATQVALERFGDLMRYVLDAGRAANADVALEDEIAFVQNYLALEKLRLGERLHVVEQFDPDALDAAVPPLLLQPLVENAVRHGIAPLQGGGTLWLHAQLVEDGLLLQVSDNGRGSEPAAWMQGHGVGLQAVRRQLAARWGSQAALDIESVPHQGFTARLTMPAVAPPMMPR